MNSSASALPAIDWAGAASWAARLVPAGPTPPQPQPAELVADLRAAAVRARDLALVASGLESVLPAGSPPAQVLVVDRAGWARAAAASFAGLASGIEQRAVPGTAMQAGTVLALLSTRVLGQFDPFGSSVSGGRLLLVAPNVLRSERAMGVRPDDFRLWVAAHEQTHALQFAAAPWLAGHIRSEATALLGELAASSAAEELATALRKLARGVWDRDGRWSLLDVLPPATRERTERLTAIMSLLEGHADVTMDAVGRLVIPSARVLRSRMEARRRSTKLPDVLLRKLLGLDAKLAQYRDGAAFVRDVGGPEALRAVWSGPEALPTAREISDPRAWLRRVKG